MKKTELGSGWLHRAVKINIDFLFLRVNSSKHVWSCANWQWKPAPPALCLFHFSNISLMYVNVTGKTKEYTQSGNGRFLAKIPSKKQPWLVRVGGALPPSFPLLTIT